MTDEQTVKALDNMVGGYTGGLVSVDGAAVFATQLLVGQGDNLSSNASNAGIIFLSHQVVHEMIDNEAQDNILKRIDRDYLPSFIPLDGLVGGTAAYLLNGFNGATAFALVHGALHPLIVKK